MKRGLRGGCLGLVLLLVLGLSLPASERGSRWLLQQVPGLQLTGFSGRLAGDWQAQRLQWRQGALRVELEDLQLRWSAACLLRLQLCIRQLGARQLALHLPPAADSDEHGSERRLPALELPLGIELTELQLGTLRVDGQPLFEGLQLAASWHADGIRLQQLRLSRGSLMLRLDGQLDPRGEWPMHLAGQLQLPEQYGQPWHLQLQLDGALQDSLQLRASSQGYLQAELQAQLQVLQAQLPVQLQLQLEQFKAWPEGPDSLMLRQLQVQLAGDRQSGYRVQGHAGLQALDGESLALTLSGQLDERQARLHSLRLQAAGGQFVELQAQLDWSAALQGSLELDLQAFPWQQLYPLHSPLQFKQLQSRLEYREGRYQGQLQAQLDGPAGPLQLQTPLQGDHQQLLLDGLQLQAGDGRLQGRLALDLAGAPGWQAELALQGLNPAYWLAAMPGRLDGRLSSQGRWQHEHPQAQAQLTLEGQLRGQPLRLQTAFQLDGEQLQLPQLQVRLGDNRITAKARLDQQLQAEVELRLPRLGQLWPGLQGQLQGRLSAAGSRSRPAAELQLEGAGLAWTQWRLAQLTLQGRLDRQQRGRLQIRLDDGLLAGQRLQQLRLLLEGDARQQALDLSLTGEPLQAALALAGQLQPQADGWQWRGQLRSGELQLPGQHWQLQAPAALTRGADGQLALAANCWQAGAARLCGSASGLNGRTQLDYRLSDFALDRLSPWLPEGLRWLGMLDGRIDLRLDDAGPQGRISLLSSGGQWQHADSAEPAGEGALQQLAYQRLELTSDVRPHAIDSRLAFVSEQLGQLQAELRLDPRRADPPLAGSIQLEGLQLGLLQPFIDGLEQLRGQVQGRGQLTGSLQAPRLDGRLQLRGGAAAGAALPLDIAGLELDVDISGDRAALQGHWRSGEHGRGQLSGQLDWQRQLRAELGLQAQQLPLDLPPYAQLQLDADLKAQLNEGRLAIRGELAVPSGAISIQQLPPSAVTVSEDAEVLGREPAESALAELGLDIRVRVGEQRLAFSGFGLKAELAGQLHITDGLQARGELQLNKGRYRAYGQKLQLRRARLLFTGPLEQPFLDIEAVREQAEVTAGLRLQGRVQQPRSEVFAEPPMSEAQALSWLLLGRPLGQGSEEGNLLAEAALGLGLAGSAPISQGLADHFGIEDFQLDTEGSGVHTQMVASGRLSDRLSLRYGVSLFEPGNSLALRYALTRQLYLEAASGLASSLDLFYRRDF